MLSKLEPVLDFFNRLSSKPPLDELEAVVRGLDLTCEDIAPWLLFSDQGYTRNLVHGADDYQVLVLCWKNGQRSQIHDHAGSCCCLRVLRGTLTETRFMFAPNGHVKAVDSRDFLPGTVVASEDMDMHQVSNLQANMADLVTLHIYAPPLRFMGNYTLTDRTRELEPMLDDFIEAAGI